MKGITKSLLQWILTLLLSIVGSGLVTFFIVEKYPALRGPLARNPYFTTLDLTPPFIAAAKSTPLLFYPFDTHWSPAGRELAAAQIAAALREPRIAKP